MKITAERAELEAQFEKQATPYVSALVDLVIELQEKRLLPVVNGLHWNQADVKILVREITKFAVVCYLAANESEEHFFEGDMS